MKLEVGRGVPVSGLSFKIASPGYSLCVELVDEPCWPRIYYNGIASRAKFIKRIIWINALTL
jgi:hypothetical protein